MFLKFALATSMVSLLGIAAIITIAAKSNTIGQYQSLLENDGYEDVSRIKASFSERKQCGRSAAYAFSVTNNNGKTGRKVFCRSLFNMGQKPS